MDIPTINGVFTWNNRRIKFYNIAEKLDIFMLKGDLLTLNAIIHARILPNAGFDHYPIILEFVETKKPMKNPFKCEKCGF